MREYTLTLEILSQIHATFWHPKTTTTQQVYTTSINRTLDPPRQKTKSMDRLNRLLSSRVVGEPWHYL